MIELALTHDASVSIAHDFLRRLTDKLLKKHPNVRNHMKQKMAPLIIRDLNTEINNEN